MTPTTSATPSRRKAPRRSSRAIPPARGACPWTSTSTLDKHLYKERHLVECCIGKLKQFRRVATRYEKTARNYLAVVTIAAIVLWLR